MRFLVDGALSPHVARLLGGAGHEAVHAFDCGLAAADDSLLLERASADGRVLVTADSDFAMLAAVAKPSAPAFILFREPGLVRAQDYVNRILDSVPALEAELAAGCIVVAGLPLTRSEDTQSGPGSPRGSPDSSRRTPRPRSRSRLPA